MLHQIKAQQSFQKVPDNDIKSVNVVKTETWQKFYSDGTLANEKVEEPSTYTESLTLIQRGASLIKPNFVQISLNIKNNLGNQLPEDIKKISKGENYEGKTYIHDEGKKLIFPKGYKPEEIDQFIHIQLRPEQTGEYDYKKLDIVAKYYPEKDEFLVFEELEVYKKKRKKRSADLPEELKYKSRLDKSVFKEYFLTKEMLKEFVGSYLLDENVPEANTINQFIDNAKLNQQGRPNLGGSKKKDGITGAVEDIDISDVVGKLVINDVSHGSESSVSNKPVGVKSSMDRLA